MSLNQITGETEVLCETSQNKTTFSINVGLHPKDGEAIQDAIIKMLNEGCGKTKSFIGEMNALHKQIQGSLKHKHPHG